jgi:hypothetical protein
MDARLDARISTPNLAYGFRRNGKVTVRVGVLV